jgi:hypothetical protein
MLNEQQRVEQNTKKRKLVVEERNHNKKFDQLKTGRYKNGLLTNNVRKINVLCENQHVPTEDTFIKWFSQQRADKQQELLTASGCAKKGMEMHEEEFIKKYTPSTDELLNVKKANTISDNVYQNIKKLKLKKFWKSKGVLKGRDKEWETALENYAQIRRILEEGEEGTDTSLKNQNETDLGVRVSLKKLLPLIAAYEQHFLEPKQILPQQLKWKFTLDARKMGSDMELLIGVVPLDCPSKAQSVTMTFPLILVKGFLSFYIVTVCRERLKGII